MTSRASGIASPLFALDYTNQFKYSDGIRKENMVGASIKN